MATVTGLTAARMMAIEAASVVAGVIRGNDLILTKFDDTEINAGNVRGPMGRGIESTEIQYAVSTSGTVIPLSGFSSTIPNVPQGQFLWTRVQYNYSFGTPTFEYTYSVSRAAIDGVNGDDGDSVTSINTYYSSSSSGTTAPSGSSWQQTIPSVPDGHFLWTRTDFIRSISGVSTQYTVSKQGEQGPKGDPGAGSVSTVNGDAGPNVILDASDVGALASNASAGGVLSGSYPNPGLNTDILRSLVPTGTVLPFAGAGAPAGFLMCQGQSVSRSTYSELFGVISTTYGSGNGSTTFNLPDLRRRSPVGTTSSPYQRGQTGGAERVTLTVSEMPSHTHRHELSANSGANPWTPQATMPALTAGNNTFGFMIGVQAGSGRLYRLETVGGNNSHENMPPWISMPYIIKT